jgi:hypothetical protein
MIAGRLVAFVSVSSPSSPRIVSWLMPVRAREHVALLPSGATMQLASAAVIVAPGSVTVRPLASPEIVRLFTSPALAV